MTDLRKAAEMALDALHNIDQSNNYDAIEALRQALSQPEQEPVAIVNEGMGGIEWLSTPLPDDTPLYTAPPHKRSISEDVGRLLNSGKGFYDDGTPIDPKEIQLRMEGIGDGVVTFTEVRIPRPPKREWVGLTDEEIEEYKWMGQDVIAVIKEVQATLKEKNGG